MAEKSPSFRLYPADWLADENTCAMTAAQEGHYIRAICFCWRQGSIPKDPIRFAAMLGKGCTEEDARVVQGLFKQMASNPQRMIHQRLQLEKQKQLDWVEKCSKGGKKSGETRRYQSKGTLRVVELPPEVKPNITYSISSSSSNNNISLPVRDLAEREEPSSKIEEDPLLEIAKSKLVEPNGSQDWESKNPYMLAGRQPLKKFPEVCLSATELRDVIALYDQSSIEHLLGNAFKAAVGRLKQMQMDGKDTARAPCYSWLIGWAYQEQLENHNKTLRIERTQKPYER